MGEFMNKNNINKQAIFAQKIEALKNDLKDYPNVKIVAATKYMSIEDTRSLVLAGIKDNPGIFVFKITSDKVFVFVNKS